VCIRENKRQRAIERERERERKREEKRKIKNVKRWKQREGEEVCDIKNE
jgi:hypothetical protein